jgi:predicted component of type VI protein secretion system
MSLEEALKDQAEASRELASAMRYYADTLRAVAAGNPGQVVAPNNAADTAATEDKPAKGGRGRKAAEPKEEPKAAASEPDPFGEEEEEAAGEPELTADAIRGLVMKVKEKNKDHALALLKKIGAETISKIDPKDYQKVVELAAKVGVTL